LASWGSTTFTEYVGDKNPDEQYATNASRVVRQLDVSPGDLGFRIQAVSDFLGYNKVAGVAGARYIQRGTPLPYVWDSALGSLLPSQQYLYAENITRGQMLGIPKSTTQLGLVGGPGAGGGGGVGVAGNFTKYRYTVEFTTRTYDIKTDNAVNAVVGDSSLGNFNPSPIVGLPDEGQMIAGVNFGTIATWPPTNRPQWSTSSRYITRWFRPAARMRVLPFGMLKWLSDNSPIREGFPFTESIGSLRYQWHMVPEGGQPLFALQNQFNTINSQYFDGYFFYTLLFKTADFKRYISPLGNVLYTVEYDMSWLPNLLRNGNGPLGWRSQLRAKGNPTVLEYEIVVDDNTNAGPRNPYAGSLFDNLFRPDQT